MCGISGGITHNLGSLPELKTLVATIVNSQIPRGPDNQSIECIPGRSAAVVLGHDRLSIIDLSDSANQPMWDAERTLCISYNGEVYNYLELRAELQSLGHHFSTQSDTEVILEAFKEWGVDAFQRFNGMFAIAIYSATDSRLWLVRDRYGVKPLYYLRDGSSLVFASTGGIIAKHFCLSPNLEYVSRGLRAWMYEDDTDSSPYMGLESLLPGHYMAVDTADGQTGGLALTIAPYYSLQERVQALQDELAGASSATLSERVLATLESAVALRLRSDVPVGVSLSGGLDSSAMAALLKAGDAHVAGFTYGSPDAKDTEGPVVATLERYLKFDVEYIRPTATEMAETFWECLAAQDSPFPGLSIVAQHMVFRAASERGVKVMIGGQGGDEVFMGYRKFLFFRLAELRRARRYAEAAAFLPGLARTITAEWRGAPEYLLAMKRYRGRHGLETGLNLPESPLADMGCGPGMEIRDRQILDATRYSLPSLLRYEDRNSMGNSVESRLPFLDYRVVELGIALPTSVKVRNGFGKWILREAMRGRIPESIRSARYKRGFDVNERAWITAGLGSVIRDGLQQRLCGIKDFLPTNSRIDVRFSDENLSARGNTLSEAITLLWLAGKV